MVLGVLIELNSAAILYLISGIAVIEYESYGIGGLGFIFAALCVLGGGSMQSKGICYRILSVINGEPPFVLNEIDPDELAREGEVILDE